MSFKKFKFPLCNSIYKFILILYLKYKNNNNRSNKIKLNFIKYKKEKVHKISKLIAI